MSFGRLGGHLHEMADLRLVDALARLRLEAARAGYRVTLRHAPTELAELVELAGLSETLALELERQAEEREQPLGVEEEGQLADPAA